MTTGAAGDGIIRGLFDCCISGCDSAVQRRPYHRNCGCALHGDRGNCSRQNRHNSVSYPIRRSWSEGSLAAMMGQSSSSMPTSPGSTPVGEIKRTQLQLLLCKVEDEDRARFGL